LSNPYPSEEAKEELARKCNITVSQVWTRLLKTINTVSRLNGTDGIKLYNRFLIGLAINVSDIRRTLARLKKKPVCTQLKLKQLPRVCHLAILPRQVNKVGVVLSVKWVKQAVQKSISLSSQCVAQSAVQ
jgi:hypothetical protein